jgi:tellurite resistance protein
MKKEKRQIKKEHFQNLVAVAIADGEYDQPELGYLSEKALDFGLSQQEVEEIKANADQLEFLIPKNKEAREEQLTDAVFMMMVDGDINEREYKLCLQIAQKLDMRKKDVDHIIDLVKELWELQAKDDKNDQ